VAEAVKVFTGELKGTPAALKVGWLMKIKLGKGLTPPVIGAHLQKWNVYSWNDSRRKANDGTNTGYEPATYFGWNPISIAAALYYMTGHKEYLDTFKALAMPDSHLLPRANATSDAFSDPANPLVKSDHYRAHLLDCIYDLIEESPLFTNEERLFITNKLLVHQLELDPTSSYSMPNGDRHSVWHMMSIYTGSRYFSYYYPNPIWHKRIENVRRAFSSFINNPTWAERDTLEWVSTSIEPIFDFYLMDGYDTFVNSGTANILLQGLTALMSGEHIDDYNRYLPINLLFKAAYLLNDTQYVWMAKQLGADFTAFRIGESYWPASYNDAKPPTDIANRIIVTPLAKTDWKGSLTPVSSRESFQLLSYRSGLEKMDDYFLLDGFEGLGRHPYQVNTLVRLRMFGGKDILNGYANDLNVWHNGMSGPHVARSAALKQQLATKEFVYVHTEVPDMPASTWQRYIVYIKDLWTVVIDKVTAMQPGRFDIASFWQMGSGIKKRGKTFQRIDAASGTSIASADVPLEQVTSNIVRGKVSRVLNTNDCVTLASLFFNSTSPKAMSPLRLGGYLLSSSQPAFVNIGSYRSSALELSADFVYIDRERLFLTNATELKTQGMVVFRSDKPVTILWDLKGAFARISSSGNARISLTDSARVINTEVTPGEHVFDLPVSKTDLSIGIDSMLTGMEVEVRVPKVNEETMPAHLPELRHVWEAAFNGMITAIAGDHMPGDTHQGNIWVVSQQERAATISRIGTDGKQLTSIQQFGEVLSIWPAKGIMQARSFGLLAGFKDDTLRAFSREGKERWRVKAAIHPSFMVGDHYEAPWFTDPRPPYNMTGVYSILVGDLWGSGKEEIAIGRPCTVEFYSLHGGLRARVATRWGNNTSLALIRNRATSGQGPLLLAGKAYTGNPQLSGINAAHTNVSDHLYDQINPGFTNMHAWLQRGTSGLRVADINGDGRDEIIYTLSGHWNELRVYDATGKTLWMNYFGPDKFGSSFMTALEVADLDGDGFKEIIVGTKNGWVIAFDHKGNILWQQLVRSGISAMSINEKRRMIAVGCQNGSIMLIDVNGQLLASGSMGARVTAIFFGNDGVKAGSALGSVRHYGATK